MGTFAELYCIGKTEIQSKEEFIEKVEKVFQCGGMMDMEEVSMYGKRLVLIRKATMDSDGMDFHYNYFEDDSWENAGFNKKRCEVWSNKIGWSAFHRAVVAAYVLEEQYTQGVAIAMVDGDFVTAWSYVGWLNYLFDEFKHVKNFDTWKLFEEYYYSKCKYPSWDDWEQWKYFGGKRYGFISSCEIYAVIYGVDKALEKFGEYIKEKTEDVILKCMWIIRDAIKNLTDSRQISSDEQCCKILELIKLYYENENSIELQEEQYKDLIVGLTVADAPAFLVKGIAEAFEKDFWELWEEIKDVVYRKREEIYGNEGCYVLPVSTEKFFRQNPNDMIPYWENDGKLEFSDELWDWFEQLKTEYNLLAGDDVIIEHPLRYMLELMEEANDDFYNIFTFAEFFEESLENMSDKKYQTLWRLYDNMIHDPELRKAADVIFVPEESGHEKDGLHYLRRQPKRRLTGVWEFMEKSKKQNIGRITLRRYMALVGNKVLREKIFGF